MNFKIKIIYFKLLKLIKILLPISLLLIVNCDIFDSNHPGAKEYYEISEMPRAEGNAITIKKFSSYPIEKQMQIYLFAECCIEGGGDWLGGMLAKDGEKNIPYLLERIEVFPDKVTNKNSLIKVFYTISKECNCFRKHPEYVKRLENVEEKIKANETSAKDEYSEIDINSYSQYLAKIKKL